MTSFRKLNQPTGRIIHQDDASYLFFGGTAYLGLLQNPDYIELYKDGIDKFGLNNGTSRTNNVQLGIYEEAEHDLAQRFGFEDAAVLSSGYLAAQIAVKFLTKGRKIYYAPDCHPSLWLDDDPGVGVDFDQWLANSIEEINASDDEEFVMISNSMDNLTPRLNDFSALSQLANNKHVTMILDDSHGIGVLRKNQVSTPVETYKAENLNIVVLASLAKGMGTDAGVVLGNSETIKKIKKHPIFLGSSPSAPAVLYALKNGKAIYNHAFDQMQANVSQLEGLVNGLKLNHITQFPVFSSQASTLYKHLINHKIVISSFPYPLSDSPLLNRIIVSALHRPADIEWLGEVLSRENILKL